MSIGSKICELRTKKNLSQGDLADILDVSRQSISKWETDTATPELDKLIKLCDVFEVSLDELVNREALQTSTIHKTSNNKKTSSTQKTIGYILFALSITFEFIILLFGSNATDFLVLSPIAVAIFVCGLLCLFAGNKAFYWCIWTLITPLATLIPHVIGLAFLSSVSIAMLIVFVIMFFVSKSVFKDTVIKATPKAIPLLILAWILPFALYGALVSLHTADITIPLPSFLYGTTLDILLNLMCYILIALLETYTIVFFNSLKKSKKKKTSL